jgi:hypothetical protein
MAAAPPFAVIFTASPVGYPIPSTSFTPAPGASGRWLLDVSAVTPAWRDLKDVTLCLSSPGALPPGAALALYVSVGGDAWQYRGAVTAAHPSDAVPLAWPEEAPSAPSHTPILGVALEPEADVAGRECAKLGARLEFGRRVGLDLFRFVESFAAPAAGGAVVLPAGALDAWWRKFEARFRRDPEFLLRRPE